MAPQARRRGNDPEQHTTFTGGATASLVLYQGGDGARLGWRVVAPIGPGELADAIVDAADGTVVKRANRVKAAAPGDALVFPSSPDAGLQQTRSLSPWGTEATRLRGARVHAFPDPDDVVGSGSQPVRPRGRRRLGRPAGRPAGLRRRHRALHMDPAEPARQQGAQRDAALLLRQHVPRPPRRRADRLQRRDRRLRPGRPDLRPVVDSAAKVGAGTRNNASFVAYPDGGPGLLDVLLFDAFGNRLDGVNDPSLVYHEVAHGMSERLVTDGQGWSALSETQACASPRARATSTRSTSSSRAASRPRRSSSGSTSGPGCATRRSTATRSPTAR